MTKNKFGRLAAESLPIGVFDSGLGGLTVVREIVKLLPHEDIIYLGDTARVPYGTRSKETVVKFALEDARFLLKKKVKCIVIACNTASALAGDELKKRLKVPVFDVVTPALRAARKISPEGRAAVIGTRGTVGSGAYDVAYSIACPLLVPFVEEGEIKNPALKSVVKDYLAPLKKKNIEALILGCTHYPIVKNIIAKNVGRKVKLVNPGLSLAMELSDYLKEENLLNGSKKSGKKIYYVTDMTKRFVEVARIFMGIKIGIRLAEL
jgi:glutamate racemase